MGRFVHSPNSLRGTHQVPSVQRGRGGMSSLEGVWHQGGALWHGPTLCEGGGGRRPLLRRCLQSPCSALGQCFQVGGLIGLEPPLLVFVRGSRWHKCVPPTLG